MKKNLLKIGISDVTSQEVLEYISKSVKKGGKKYYIVTPNPELLMLARKDKQYESILNEAELALPDGVGVMIAGRLLGKPFKERITGVGLVEKICSDVAKRPITVGFLGGGPKIAVTASERLVEKYPGLKVVYAGEEWPSNELTATRSNIDILFVAYGSPKQEIWIKKNLNKIPVRVAIGVGGAFDFISGNVKRAPLWVQNAGFEWLYRLAYQPWRLKRQTALLRFVYEVGKEKLLS